MTIARKELVDVSVTPWYHCITRCVRRALLLGEGLFDRRQWVEDRIEELAQIFAVGVGGFSVMDNHLHLLVRLDQKVAGDWSDDEVVRRWGRLYPPRDKSRKPLPISEEWVQGRLKDIPWVAKTRERLQSISWFMKCLKEPISRRANREDKCLGNYLLLVDYTGRLFREGKATISAELAGILERIGSSAESWQVQMEKLKNGRSFGRFFAASRQKLRDLAARLRVRHLVNFVGCAAP
jgi:hypothetical protein